MKGQMLQSAFKNILGGEEQELNSGDELCEELMNDYSFGSDSQKDDY
jgi:hypothetical protein